MSTQAMQAVTTKQLDKTTDRPIRVSAVCYGRQRGIYLWDYTQTLQANHDIAATELIRKLGWFGKWARASIDPTMFCYVALTQNTSAAKFSMHNVIEIKP